jgi:hypothetical protein
MTYCKRKRQHEHRHSGVYGRGTDVELFLQHWKRRQVDASGEGPKETCDGRDAQYETAPPWREGRVWRRYNSLCLRFCLVRVHSQRELLFGLSVMLAVY